MAHSGDAVVVQQGPGRRVKMPRSCCSPAGRDQCDRMEGCVAELEGFPACGLDCGLAVKVDLPQAIEVVLSMSRWWWWRTFQGPWRVALPTASCQGREGTQVGPTQKTGLEDIHIANAMSCHVSRSVWQVWMCALATDAPSSPIFFFVPSVRFFMIARCLSVPKTQNPIRT